MHFATGNLLEFKTDALVNTVNCVGIMGKGIALQFKKKFPENFKQYERACRSGEVQLGKMFIVPTNNLSEPHYIINFPTKDHWRNPSRLESIATGLQDLVAQVKKLNIKSIAIPPLGCGNGGLEWSEVRP
jgi:O-acetyl-ADP-ribose deacetylase (regulator of RNase III)